MALQQQKARPVPGIINSNVQISYTLSRIVSPLSGGNADSFFNNLPYDFDNPNEFLGRTQLDHTNELSLAAVSMFDMGCVWAWLVISSRHRPVRLSWTTRAIASPERSSALTLQEMERQAMSFPELSPAPTCTA